MPRPRPSALKDRLEEAVNDLPRYATMMRLLHVEILTPNTSQHLLTGVLSSSRLVVFQSKRINRL
jgi:hypothetical protein